jgi:hypothetical protein
MKDPQAFRFSPADIDDIENSGKKRDAISTSVAKSYLLAIKFHARLDKQTEPLDNDQMIDMFGGEAPGAYVAPRPDWQHPLRVRDADVGAGDRPTRRSSYGF